VKDANLVLRFALELGALVAVAYWGFTTQEGIWRWVAGLGAPVVVIAVWWLFIAPKRRLETPGPLRFGIELGVWATASVALAAAGRTALAVGFAAVAVVSGALNYVWS
jgi:hypothetical protein